MPSTGAQHPAIAIDDAWKAFDGRPALKGASFEVLFGEVHALLGENGAGKSTLMNLVCGLYAADAGTITIDGASVLETDPRAAARHGIGMVHQHFKLIPRFTVAENILVACGEVVGLKGRADAATRLAGLAADLGFGVDPHARIGDLSVAERQRVEILRLLLLDARILILDEPTAVLTDAEADAVLALLRRLAGEGRAVVLITHRLREVQNYADRVTVMRAGETVLAGAPCAGYDRKQLADLMVGSGIRTATPRVAGEAGPVRLDAAELTVDRPDGSRLLDRINLQLHAGEIVGIAGVGGNGQDAFVEALYGLRDLDAGTLTLDGTRIERASVGVRRGAGLRVIPADRNDFALIAAFRAYENLALTEVARGGFGHWVGFRRGQMRARAEVAMTERAVVGGGPRTPTRLLSGGNAQKLLLARELAPAVGKSANVLIAHSPTRGLDVAACQAVHQALFDLVAAGGACLLVSEDLDEVLELSDRVGVISRGRLFGPFPHGEIDRAQVGALMLGHD